MYGFHTNTYYLIAYCIFEIKKLNMIFNSVTLKYNFHSQHKAGAVLDNGTKDQITVGGSLTLERTKLEGDRSMALNLYSLFSLSS